MSTQAQSDAARANGAKSHGPKTPEGRLKSSLNAMQHGLFAQTLVLPHEDREQFDQIHLSYFEKFQPTDDVEADLVQTMVAARWRQQRVWALETHTLQLETIRRSADLGQPITPVSAPYLLAAAYGSLADNSKALAQIARAEATYSRQYDRALNQLLKLRKSGIVSAPLEPVQPELQNEPEPVQAAPSAPPRNEPKPPPAAPPVRNEPKPAVQYAGRTEARRL